MENRITIEGRDGAFGAYIARPKTLPAPAVVVLHEVFGVNADIRKTCDELADQGLIAIAPDLFWRQAPGVDLSVTSEPDWQHGLPAEPHPCRNAVTGGSRRSPSGGQVSRLPPNARMYCCGRNRSSSDGDRRVGPPIRHLFYYAGPRLGKQTIRGVTL